MEKELARRRVFRDQAWTVESLLCLHATSRGSFTRDPVFPDSADTSLVSRASGAVRAVAWSARAGFVQLTFARGGAKHAVRVRREVYDRVSRLYRGDRFHSDLWLAVYRYETLGLFSGLSGSVPPRVYRALRRADKRAVECFASFFNATLPGYFGLFPDLEAPFGCRGNFFAITRMRSLMLCNPPFERCVVNAFVAHVLALLARSRGQCLAILPAFDTGHRDLLNRSGKCRTAYATDYATDFATETLRASAFARWSALFCRESFAYSDMATGATVHYTSTLVCLLSSLERPRARVAEAVVRALPRPDIVLGAPAARP